MESTPFADSRLLDAPADDPAAAAATLAERGAVVLRGAMREHVAAVRADVDRASAEALALLEAGEGRSCDEGLKTPDGTLFIPAPEGFPRPWQIMVLGLDYHRSAAFLRSAFEDRVVDVVEGILGPDVELFGRGQCLCKEPVGGHPKLLHQDGAYFEHRDLGPVAALTYAVDVDADNGPLHVVPDSHRGGVLPHVDTESHLGLPPGEWGWERAVPIHGAAGDTVLFLLDTVHGSPPNRSRAPRPVFIHRYRRPGDRVVVSATTAAKRRAAEARRGEGGGGQPGGWMVRGFRSVPPGGDPS